MKKPTSIRKVEEFEKDNTFWEKTNEIFKNIHSYNKEIIPALKKLKTGFTYQINIPEDDVNYLASLIEFLEKHNILKIDTKLAAARGPEGTFYLCYLVLLEKFHDVVNSKEFNV